MNVLRGRLPVSKSAPTPQEATSALVSKDSNSTRTIIPVMIVRLEIYKTILLLTDMYKQ